MSIRFLKTLLLLAVRLNGWVVFYKLPTFTAPACQWRVKGSTGNLGDKEVEVKNGLKLLIGLIILCTLVLLAILGLATNEPAALTVVWVFITIIAVGSILWAWARIFFNAGYNRWLCFLMFVPIINLAMLFWFAFSKWPVYEYVQEGWYIQKLKTKQAQLEKEIQTLKSEK